MILTIIIGFVLAFGVWYLWHQDIGYVNIDVLGYQFQASAVVALFALVLGFIALYIVVRLIGSLWRTPKRMRQWADKQSTERAHVQTARGYTALIEGDFEKAERKLVMHADKHSTPVLNYIAAANAAQQRKDYVHRDRYLRLALEADPDGSRAIGLTKARLQYEAGQLKESQATLHALHAVAPDSPKVVRLLLEVQRELGDWQGMSHMLPHSKQLAAHDADELAVLEREIHQNLLAAPVADDEEDVPSNRLETRWKQLKGKQRKDPAIVRTFVEQLIDNHEMQRAEKELRVTLKREWDSDLAYLYGKAIGPKPQDQFNTAKEWEKLQPHDPDLLLTLGRLALECESWDEARSYLQASINRGGRDEARSELAALLEELGDTEAALATYRDGMVHLTGTEPKKIAMLPAPSTDDESV